MYIPLRLPTLAGDCPVKIETNINLTRIPAVRGYGAVITLFRRQFDESGGCFSMEVVV